MSFGFDKVKKSPTPSERTLDLSGLQMQTPQCRRTKSNELWQEGKRSGLRRESQAKPRKGRGGNAASREDSDEISVYPGSGLRSGSFCGLRQ